MARSQLDDLGRRLGIELRDPRAIQQAFVHSSYYNENPQAVAGHNERLEFLGDAVIGLIVSRLLYERYPDEDEGFLTARRAALVNRDALASLALDLHFDEYLLLGRGEADAGGATRPSLMAATFEAVTGAIFLAEGMPFVRDWLRRLFMWTQRHRHTKPRYELVEVSGPAHEQLFSVAAVLDGRRLAVGHGSSRQRAEEDAAGIALATLDVESDVTGASW
jgi:ribonuclease III